MNERNVRVFSFQSSASRCLLLVGFLSACSGGRQSLVSEVTPLESSSPPPQSEVPNRTTTSTSDPPISAPAESKTPAPLTGFNFELLLDQAVTSFALGNGPRISVLSDEPWIFDGQKWKEAQVPKHLRSWEAGTARVRIFYGRDNQPRLMGFAPMSATSGAQMGGVYLRHQLSGWRREPAELGRLGNSRGALYGILGEADPEVVCRPGDVCLIKRVSGWGQTPADAEPAWIQMVGDQVFKATASQVSLLVLNEWQMITEDRPPGEVTSMGGHHKNKLYLVAGGQLFRLTEAKWELMKIPFESCFVVAAPTENDVWVGGATGLCRLTNGDVTEPVWSCSEELVGSVVQLEVTATSLFVGSDKGLWRGNVKMEEER